MQLSAVPEVRIKEIASIGGIRENQLVGIGLVTGLAGNGDSSNSKLLQDAVANLVTHFGFDISPKDVRSRNCAVVMVSATVPPFMRSGEKIDVLVSSLGDARSLDRGILLQTPLRAGNGDVFAVAQGPIAVSVERNLPKTVGTIAFGAIAEREVVSNFVNDNRITLILRHPDFVTASAVRDAIAGKFPGLSITVRDSALIEILIPDDQRNNIAKFISDMETVTVKPDPSSKVVIDSKSGVIIIGEQVKIGKVAVSYKTASVSVGSYYSQSTGNKEQFVIQETVTVEDFIKTVRDIGLNTDTIIEILKAIEDAGALYGTLIIN
jgi:flagellar P-ring protein precursor FlgI